MPVPRLTVRLYIHGLMPERALLRLRREGIPVYDVKKTDKDKLLIGVDRQNVKRVFALYPSARKGNVAYSSFTVSYARQNGLFARLKAVKKRTGLFLGGLLFLILTSIADGFVFGVDFVGTDRYERETYMALREAGIRMFAPYRAGREDLVCANLLAIDGVEFCSVKKRGLRLVVEIRISPFGKEKLQSGCLRADVSGKILSVAVLRGTPLKGVGDEVKKGEPIVGNWLLKEDGEKISVSVIARVRMACVYQREIAIESEEKAFATAYLDLGAEDDVTVTEREILPTDGGFSVKITYEKTQTINF